MPSVVVPWRAVLALGLAALALPSAIAPAQEAKTGTAIQETEEDKQEREGRRQCAVTLCSTLHKGQPADGQVTCNIQKTWRKEVISKVLARGKASWPWGDTRCTFELKLDRSMLVKAMQEPEFEAQLETYDVRCQIANDKDKYDVTARLRPKITFKQGKATKASLNWGKIEAPTLAKTALWSITAVDNTFGLLQGTAVEDINEFIGTKCMEVKEEWQGK